MYTCTCLHPGTACSNGDRAGIQCGVQGVPAVKQLWSRQNMHMCSMHSLPLRLSWTCSETERRPGRSDDHLFNAHTMYICVHVHVILYI